MKNFKDCTKYYSSEEIKQDEMDKTCSTYGEQGIRRGYWWGNVKSSDYFEGLGLDGKIILKRA
jgi:hypothetical protein